MGYTSISEVLFTNATNTAFRAWGSAVANAFANSGWTKVPDTGTHIDWDTVAAPTTNNTIQGYEIWQMGDALQATAPILLKIQYGSHTAAAYPRVILELGTAANSSGNLTTAVSPPTTNVYMTSAEATNTHPIFFAGDTDRMTVVWQNVGTAARSMLFSVERSRNANGETTNVGATVLISAGVSYDQFAWTPTTSNTTAYEGSWGLFMPIGWISSTGDPLDTPDGRTFEEIGAQQTVYPIFHNMGGYFSNPTTTILGYCPNDLWANTVLLVPLYGTPIPYLALGDDPWQGQYVGPAGGRTNESAFMIRWD